MLNPRKMLNKIYAILPEWMKRVSIWSFLTMRKVVYILFRKRKIGKLAKDREFSDNFNSFQCSRRYGPLKHFCFAPYKSMFFSLHGKMAPCYATYNERSDVYANTSIRKSWFTGSFEIIRKEHEHFDFSTNCEFCNQLFVNKAYGSMLMQKYEHYAFAKSNYPAIMEFELSNRCNLECIMCDSNLSSSIAKRNDCDVRTNDIYGEKFINELREFIPHLRMAEFTGGDPFLIEIYYEIWDLIIELNPNCEILITTNANTMSDRIRNLMSRTSRLHFNVSIDAVTKETYEKIRINGNFDKALANIVIFHDYCKMNKTSLNLLVCPMTVNARELPQLIELGNSFDAGVFFHTVVKPENLSLKFADIEMLDELITYLNRFSFPQKTWNQRVNAENYNNLITLIRTWGEEVRLRKTQPTVETVEKTNSAADRFYKQIMASANEEQVRKMEQLASSISKHPEKEILMKQIDEMSDIEIMQCFEKFTVEEFISFVRNQRHAEN